MNSRWVLVSLVALLLLLFGPSFPSYSGIPGYAFSVLSLVGLSIMTWFVQKVIWIEWKQPHSEKEKYFNFLVFGALAGILIAGGFHLAQTSNDSGMGVLMVFIGATMFGVFAFSRQVKVYGGVTS